MTRVDFYLLQGGATGSTPGGGGNIGDDAKLALVCRLTDKAFRLGHKIYIYTPDAALAARIDDLLWVQNPGSFIPHHIYKEGEPIAPVAIGAVPPPPALDEVLVTLSAEVPDFFSRFARVAELVGADETEKAQSRVRFRFYRDRGYALQTHTVA